MSRWWLLPLGAQRAQIEDSWSMQSGQNQRSQQGHFTASLLKERQELHRRPFFVAHDKHHSP
jgi:hypothetical protein